MHIQPDRGVRAYRQARRHPRRVAGVSGSAGLPSGVSSSRACAAAAPTPQTRRPRGCAPWAAPLWRAPGGAPETRRRGAGRPSPGACGGCCAGAVGPAGVLRAGFGGRRASGVRWCWALLGLGLGWARLALALAGKASRRKREGTCLKGGGSSGGAGGHTRGASQAAGAACVSGAGRRGCVRLPRLCLFLLLRGKVRRSSKASTP